MTKKAGLTGNIGSGKTTIANIFRTLNVPVYIADERAKILLASAEVKNEIRTTFGTVVFDKNFRLDRKKLADLVFPQSELLAKLNEIIHPRVRRDFDQWFQQHSAAPYIVYEAAILVESGFYKNLDKLIVVAAPETIRRQRVIMRDQTTVAAFEARNRQQLPESVLRSKADFVIDNDNQKLVIPQVLKIHNELSTVS
jgi:dephospho-CoA kinase